MNTNTQKDTTTMDPQQLAALLAMLQPAAGVPATPAPTQLGAGLPAAVGAPAQQVDAATLAALGAALATAKDGNNNGQKLPIGTFVVDVTCVAVRNTYFGQRFIVEFTVLEASTTDVQIGGEYSWAVATVDQYGYGPNDIKGWICSLVEAKLQRPRQQWDNGFTAWVCGADQPARGSRWKVDVWEKPSKNTAGRSKLIHDWVALPAGATVGLRPVAPTHTTITTQPSGVMGGSMSTIAGPPAAQSPDVAAMLAALAGRSAAPPAPAAPVAPAAPAGMPANLAAMLAGLGGTPPPAPAPVAAPPPAAAMPDMATLMAMLGRAGAPVAAPPPAAAPSADFGPRPAQWPAELPWPPAFKI